jgi:guanylate kinase
MLEWAEYNGNLYGTPRGPVEAALAAGRPALLEIDLAGARQVRAVAPEALQVFLMPPTWEELERRLRERGTEDPAEREARLATAKAEVAAASEFDAVVVNDDLERAVAELERLMGLD